MQNNSVKTLYQHRASLKQKTGHRLSSPETSPIFLPRLEINCIQITTTIDYNNFLPLHIIILLL